MSHEEPRAGRRRDPMTDDPEREAAEPARDWDRRQMEIDDTAGDEDRPIRGDASPGGREQAAPDWNKGQMEFDDGGETQRRIDPDAMPESEEGPTGLRSNPGGGERFGLIDDEEAEDRPRE